MSYVYDVLTKARCCGCMCHPTERILETSLFQTSFSFPSPMERRRWEDLVVLTDNTVFCCRYIH